MTSTAAACYKHDQKRLRNSILCSRSDVPLIEHLAPLSPVPALLFPPIQLVDPCAREGLVALGLADSIPSPPTQAYFLFCVYVPAEAPQRPTTVQTAAMAHFQSEDPMAKIVMD